MLNFIKIIFVTVSLIILNTNVFAQTDLVKREFRYLSVSDPQRYGLTFIEHEDGRIQYIVNNHTGSLAIDCSVAGKYLCLDSKIFTYVYYLDENRTRWTYKGIDYSREYIDEISFLGQSFSNIEKISFKQSDTEFTFFVAKEIGVFLINVKYSDNVNYGLILSEKYGLFSNK